MALVRLSQRTGINYSVVKQCHLPIFIRPHDMLHSVCKCVQLEKLCTVLLKMCWKKLMPNKMAIFVVESCLCRQFAVELKSNNFPCSPEFLAAYCKYGARTRTKIVIASIRKRKWLLFSFGNFIANSLHMALEASAFIYELKQQMQRLISHVWSRETGRQKSSTTSKISSNTKTHAFRQSTDRAATAVAVVLLPSSVRPLMNSVRRISSVFMVNASCLFWFLCNGRRQKNMMIITVVDTPSWIECTKRNYSENEPSNECDRFRLTVWIKKPNDVNDTENENEHENGIKRARYLLDWIDLEVYCLTAICMDLDRLKELTCKSPLSDRSSIYHLVIQTLTHPKSTNSNGK